MKFDIMWLESFDEKIIMETIGSKITPLVVNPGKIILSNLNLYFQPFNNIEPHQYIKIRLSLIKTIIRRRFLLQHVGLEIYCEESNSISHLYLSLKSSEARDGLYDTILKQPELHLFDSKQEIMTLQWQNGTISNFEYLLYVNSMADRTFNDLTQYPVFPWIISDYSSPTLDLSNSSSFRDLTKPIGALNPERLTRLKSRFSEMASPKFLYGSHYSTPGFVLFYLVRKYPHYMLCLQNGRFDHPDRMFNSVSDTWKNVLTNMSDFKELVPEFYDTSCRGEFLKNLYGVNFGCKYDGSKVNDVQLPPWGETPEDFVHKLRTALESNYVSSHLHEWIDLIFGYKQRGDEALKADNKFYYLCYEGAIDLDSIKDWNQRHAVEVQIMEFGQIPRQVFKQPHPARICLTLELENRFARSVENTDDFVNNDTNYHIEHYWKWDIIQSEASFCFQSHKEEITDIAVSHDSSIMFSVSRDGLFKMFDIIDFKQERSLSFSRTALTSIILLEDNDTAIIGCWDSSILVYNIECGSIIDKVVIHEDAVNCLGWCKKTKRLISASFDCSIRVWKANIPWNTLKLSSSLLAQLHHDTKIPCLTICSNEKLMASGSENGVIYIWSLKTYKIAFRLNGHEKQVTDMKFSYRAERLISCSQDHSFRVFDLSTGSQVYYKYLDQEINSILWDDCHVVLGGNLGTLFVWNLVKNTLINQIQAHAGGVTTISYSKDGSVIITGGRDGKIYIWTTFNYNI